MAGQAHAPSGLSANLDWTRSRRAEPTVQVALSRVRLLFEVGHAAEDLEDQPEIALSAEVCDPDAFEVAAEDHINPSFGLHYEQLVEAPSRDGDVVHAPALLDKETRVDALLVERLDQFSLQLAHHSDCHAPGALDRLAVFAEILPVKFVDLPRTDPVLVDIFPHRRVKVAHHNSDLHRLGEDRVGHHRTSCAQHGTARKLRQIRKSCRR